MKCVTSLATLAAVSLIAGCSGNTVDTGSGQAPGTSTSSPLPGTNGTPPASPAPSPASSAPATLEVDANLRALRDLQIFELSGIVESIPEGVNTAAYAGIPEQNGAPRPPSEIRQKR